jgi:putative flippase GtrA
MWPIILNLSRKRIKSIADQFLSFARVGIFITLLSLFLTFFFLKIIGTPLIITYVLLYISTISLSFFLNSIYTFKAERSLKRLLMYYGSYAFSMLLGVILLSFLRRLTPYENWILAFLVKPFTMASNFLLSSLIFENKHD